MLRRVYQILALLVVAGAVGWAFWPRPIEVETAIVGPQDIKITIKEEGKSRIREIYTISAPVSGQAMRIQRHAGDLVQKGDVLASIQPAPSGLLDTRLRSIALATAVSAKAGVDLAAAEVRQAEAQLAFLRGELSRAEKLSAQNTISVSALEKARLAVDTAVAALESAKASLGLRTGELERANAGLIETTESDGACCAVIKAPVAGRILRVFAENEQIIAAGTPLVQIGDPSDLEITAELLSQDVVEVQAGAAAQVLNWGGPALDAKVKRVEPSAVSKISALGIEEQRVPVVIEITNMDKAAALGDGFRVSVEITLSEIHDVLAVPVPALFRRGDSWTVFQVQKGKAVSRPIVLGRRNNMYAEVISGLDSGSEIILYPSDQLSDGQSVMTKSIDN